MAVVPSTGRQTPCSGAALLDRAGAREAGRPSAQHPDRAPGGEGTLTGLPFQVETTVYVIVRCKLDERVTTEAEFSPEESPSVRVEAKLENEYTVSVKAPSK